MKKTHETERQAHQCRNGASLASIARYCQQPLDAIPRIDVPPINPSQLRHVDSALSLDSHDVDANADRRHFFVERQYRPRMSQQHPTMADRNRAAWNRQRPRNTGGPSHSDNRHQAFDPSGIGFQCFQPVKAKNVRLEAYSTHRRGQALIEMALLIPLLIVIIGATISFGLFFFQANVLQQAVDVAAMEIARMPFDPTAELGLGDLDANASTLLWDPGPDGTRFRTEIYDPKFLVVHDAEWDETTVFKGSLLDYAATWPLLNRLLVPVMVRDSTYPVDEAPDPVDNDPFTVVTRYPGAVVKYRDPVSGRIEETVLIPIISYDTTTGAESLISWVAPVEEIRVDHDNNITTPIVGPFSLDFDPLLIRPSFVPGMVALRINYPAQSTTLINRTGDIIDADDSSIVDGNTGSNYSLVVPAETGPADTTIHSGRFGLGRQAALLRSAGVRPFRKVMSVQAIYRREVFH
jgi:hypothetical protein